MTIPENSKTKNKNLAFLQGWVSILVNSLLFIFKYWAGIVSGSLALKADAWHTLSDSISSIIVLIGTKISNKPPDKEHPFGHGRAELISSVIIGVILAVVAFEFSSESIRRLINREGVQYGSFAVIVTIISVVIKEGLAQFSFYAFRKTNNPMLKADGWHHRSDAISSAIILVGIFFGKYYWWIDGVLGLIVACLIFYAAYEIIREGIDPLMGEEPDETILSNVQNIARFHCKNDPVVHHVHVHRYGEHIEMTLHIKLPKDISLEKAHEIATNIEVQILNEMNIEATIHMEPLYEMAKSSEHSA